MPWPRGLPLADQAWLLLQIGLGGCVVGRSVEKISPQITAISHAAPPRRRHGPQVKPRPKSDPPPAMQIRLTRPAGQDRAALRDLLERHEGRRAFPTATRSGN